ncbi:type 1 glutamine amidotransferase [Streptomyces sp. WMMB 322]|uniref:type 1 glutamine amidotransferase n=1 Tax=Streptomyces sp. WMMB 322 TaxID=1286821 RepID=UPI0006E408BA|nr:type 1 glutamine amidotransferase [Streptomyces sp. WMMB 322]SCK23419.1 GMP synthase-Glutamine amidotransferase [Streptomyces sp. WMMB 322]
MRRVLVVQNTPAGGPGRIGDWLGEEGLALDVVHAYDGGQLPRDLSGHHGLLVLGGGYMPDADGSAPWLAAVRGLARQALKKDVPVLGICLGAQLLAHVAGGTVRARHGLPESGSTELTLLPEASDDALFHGLPPRLKAVEHRVDAITALPRDAQLLASSERCPVQAFRVGDRAWGLQFHPEATPHHIRGWDAEALREQGFDREELVLAAERDEPAARTVWHTLTRRFAAVVSDG